MTVISPKKKSKKKEYALEIAAQQTYHKAPPAVVHHRVKELLSMMMYGETRGELLRYGSEKWNITNRQVEEYLQRARATLMEINKVSLEENASLIIKNLWAMFKEHHRDNPELARKIIMDIAKLKGLDQVTVNHVLKDERDMSGMSDGELDTLLIEG